jgi:hypothetical protein
MQITVLQLTFCHDGKQKLAAEAVHFATST